jgi:hypothetical protein
LLVFAEAGIVEVELETVLGRQSRGGGERSGFAPEFEGAGGGSIAPQDFLFKQVKHN